MQIIRIQRKFGSLISTLLLALLALLPLFFLHQLLLGLKTKDEDYLELLAQERLVIEMGKFQDMLEPSKYIGYALEKMNRDFGFTLHDAGGGTLKHSFEGDPKLIDAKFPEKMRRYLKKEFGIEPLLVVAADCDLQNVFADYRLNIFNNASEQADFEKAAAFHIFFSEFFPVNLLPNTEPLYARFRLYKDSNNKELQNSQMIFAKRFTKHISIFANPAVTPDSCHIFFSNRFGNQHSYQLLHRITRERGEQESILGGYYVIINSSDINFKMMLQHALRNSASDTSRQIAKQIIKQPSFTRAAGQLLYHSNFSSIIHTAVEEYALKNEAISVRNSEFLREHCLVTSIDIKHLKSKLAQAILLNASLIKLTILAIFAVWVRLLMGKGQQNFKLSGKLRVAVALIVLLPISGFFIVSELIKKSSERLEIMRFQNLIERQVRLFEKIINNNDSRLVLMLQEAKRIAATRYFSLPQFSAEKLWQKSHMSRLSIINKSFSINGDGETFAIKGLPISGDQSKAKAPLFTILSELAAINPNTPAAKSLLKQQLFLSSLAENYSNQYFSGEVLANESMTVANFLTLAYLKKACYQLLARPETPDKIEALLFHDINDSFSLQNLFKQLCYQQRELFGQYSENYQIDFGLFTRSPTNLHNRQYPRSVTGNNQLRDLALMALENRSSGTSISRVDNKFILGSWRYSDNCPVIITARATFQASTGNSLIFTILPFCLLLYAIFAITLLSDLLAEIFLAPVRTLIQCVDSMQNNHLDVKAEINSGDEFSELAKAFNLMSEGLCQRQKMRRFVSEKLFSSLQNDSQTESTKVQLTILSSDIRGFTAISEEHQPEIVVSLLNQYFALMEIEICRYGGSMEKIVGDAIIAAFYQDDEQEGHAKRACLAARAMKKRLAELNRQRLAQNSFTIATGIGIASGEAVLGFAGTSKKRREFILLGEVIHHAETLEALTKEGKSSRIFIDDNTNKLLDVFITRRELLIAGQIQPVLELDNE